MKKHTSLYQSLIYLKKDEHPPECTACLEAYTVKNIITDCDDHALMS